MGTGFLVEIEAPVRFAVLGYRWELGSWLRLKGQFASLWLRLQKETRFLVEIEAPVRFHVVRCVRLHMGTRFLGETEGPVRFPVVKPTEGN